jgi:phospholipase C
MSAPGGNLGAIDHIVVLMLENRSFDHMLGYLRLEGGRPDVDGLLPSMANEYAGATYPVHHLPSTRLGDQQDPCHSGACVADQLAGGNAGFVSNYAATHPGDPDPGLVMGYYNAVDVDVYDHLAKTYAVCDAWYSSVPGATWPNRLYAVCGRADGSKDGRDVPIYDIPSFVRHLDDAGVGWRWYSHDVATLRLCDAHYWLGHFDRFAYFDRRSLLQPHSFLDDAAAGRLPAVSWIDPNFVDVTFVGPSGSNDDHPPSDIRDGQELVLKTYNAVVRGPAWPSTLLVITYDEHGGFFDHVQPPAAPDDHPDFRQYGVRVPALVVSPLIDRGVVSHAVYDHTSIIATILRRFCRAADGSVPSMGRRVDEAADLGGLLTRTAPRPSPGDAQLEPLAEAVAQRHADLARAALMTPTAGAADPAKLNDLQQGLLAAREELRKAGLPEGQP